LKKGPCFWGIREGGNLLERGGLKKNVVEPVRRRLKYSKKKEGFPARSLRAICHRVGGTLRRENDRKPATHLVQRSGGRVETQQVEDPLPEKGRIVSRGNRELCVDQADREKKFGYGAGYEYQGPVEKKGVMCSQK